MSKSPFKTAEDYIQLRKVCAPLTMEATMRRISDMILIPLITLFLLCLGQADVFGVVSAASTTYRSWDEWIRYNELRADMQNMYLHAMRVGGPFIVTNDPDYMPYVWADAVVRTQMGLPG
jgi:predicted alpha/beta hydrolase